MLTHLSHSFPKKKKFSFMNMAGLDNYWSLFPTIFLVLLLKIFIFKKKPTKPRFNLPPGPRKLPIIGNLHQLGNSPHISLRNLAQKYGPIIYLDLGQIPTVVISSASLAKEALTNDLPLSSRPELIAGKYLLYNSSDIAFSPYGPYWRYIRKICILELLSAKRVQSLSFTREEEVSRLVRRLAEPYPGTVNLSKMLELYSNDLACRASFGRDFSEGGDFDRKGFQKMLEEFQELMGGFSLADFFPSVEWLVLRLTGMKSRLVQAFNQFDALFDQIVAAHLDPKREKDENNKDLVDILLDIQRNGSGEMPLTMNNVKALLMDMFFAGTDTTYMTLEWAMTELIINPKSLQEAQAEVRSLLGERRVVLESDLPHLNYMKAVIKETLRLHPPSVLVPRESLEHVVICGYDIPAKTRILINLWAILRDPQTWEDPETFKPERFLGSSIDYKGQDFKFIPFGAGRRMCPGMAFATVSMELALTQLLHSFDWELPPGVTAKDLDMTEVFGLTMHRKYGLDVLAKPYFHVE